MNFVVALLIPLSVYQKKGYPRVVDQLQGGCDRKLIMADDALEKIPPEQTKGSSSTRPEAPSVD
jgi:hypothetical protein